ncbi:MFS transporter [Pseudonocardia parietis]|uniref:EmrB/QacA subfamily drug resistance transporter n=1 Tax=Pseudonocardia parietis TaxID=570936 RepID=A0ABS4VSX3_9PSEU|nr:MFS transporter [Pseudonocardia parietis]MBP2367034.1 EmrB/QacA subfamily drug resistance transporter [Pseudonocardia parietis]
MTTGTTVGGPERARAAVTLVAVLLGFLTLPMLMSGTTVALPHIAADLDASGAALQWVVVGYFLAAASMMLVAGSLGDLVGRRKIFSAGAGVYTAGVLAGAFAGDILLLDVARTVSGVGAAGVMAGGGAILGATFTGPARTRAFAAMGSTAGIGISIGPSLSGLLVDTVGWRATFGVFAVVGALILLASTLIVETRAEHRPRVDVPGALLLVAALTLVMFGVNQASEAGWSSAPVVGTVVAGAVLLAVFVLVERRRTDPVLDLTLFADRRFSAWCLACVFVAAGPAGVMVFLPTYLQGVNDLAPRTVGLIMLMQTVPVLIAPQLSERLLNRWGVSPRVLIVLSLMLIAAGNVWLTTLHPGIGAAGLLGPLATLGVGMGLAVGTTDGQAMDHIDADRLGMAAGVLNTVRTTGSTLTIAVFGTGVIGLLQARSGDGESAARIAAGDLAGPDRALQAAHYTEAWQIASGVIGAACLAAALTVGVLLGRRRPEGTRRTPTTALHEENR